MHWSRAYRREQQAGRGSSAVIDNTIQYNIILIESCQDAT